MPVTGETDDDFRPRTHGNVSLRFCIVYCSQLGIENNQLIAWNNTKTQENVSVSRKRFPAFFVLFTVLKGIENNQLITWNNTKTQENVSDPCARGLRLCAHGVVFLRVLLILFSVLRGLENKWKRYENDTVCTWDKGITMHKFDIY